jgi:RNA polymerase sigma-54 factor
LYINLTTANTQTTQLNLTPELRQSLFILQFSSEELADFLQIKAVENPLLDIDWPSTRFGGTIPKSAWEDPKDRFLNNIRKPEDTIETMLISQLRLRNLAKSTFEIAKYLAGNLNEAGYLDVPLEVVSQACGANEDEVLDALSQLQNLEPTGIGARDLKECLLLQICRDSNPDPWAEVIIENYLQELGCGKLKRLATLLHISEDRLRVTLDYIRTLNPRPGLAFDHQPQNYRQPDAIIRKVQGDYELVLTDAYLPKVAVNEEYVSYLSRNMSGDGSLYLRNHTKDAQQLLRSLEQRRTTLRRVIEIIMMEQRAFLEYGVSLLKPLNLKSIAVQLDLHESTISRAVQSKFIQTPQGVCELKYFFPSGVMTVEGENASAESIKSIIKRLVDLEDKRHPLSDQQITDLLVKEGIQISRRTVMKYREEVNILSSRLRS